MHIVNIYISYLKMVRASQIVWVLAKHSFSELFAHSRLGKRRRRKNKGQVHKHVYTTPERLRMTIEELGPTFVKFGQILADRPDMVSERFRVELKKLQSRAEPFDNNTALGLIEKEMNAPIDEVFAEFDTTPLAAASIGQVYQGRLRSGDQNLFLHLNKLFFKVVPMLYPIIVLSPCYNSKTPLLISLPIQHYHTRQQRQPIVISPTRNQTLRCHTFFYKCSGRKQAVVNVS